MKTSTISKLFEGGGLIIHKSINESIFDFQYNEIVKEILLLFKLKERVLDMAQQQESKSRVNL